jgi:hypothetical protein
MAVSVKITVSWDVMPYSLVDRYQHFRGICCLLEFEAAGSFEMLVQHDIIFQNTAILHMFLLQ